MMERRAQPARPLDPPAQWPAVSFRRLVVKLGTNLLTGGTGRLDPGVMGGLVNQVATLHREGHELVIVSSGAVAAGRDRLGQVRRLRHVPLRQVYAAVGQSLLMAAYDGLFRSHDIPVAQTLLTRSDLQDRLGYLNARNTLLGLMDLGVIPIVNENDVVAVDELERPNFGDNDSLSALVATLIDADALVLLSDIDGLYTADPRTNPTARRVPLVRQVDGDIEAMAGSAVNERSRGGMPTKIQAARLVTAAGIAMIVADGREPGVLLRLMAGEPAGTLFLPVASKLESRKRWLLSGLSQRGAIVVDDGAAAAVSARGGSLLAAGVLDAEGGFDRGDTVAIRSRAGRLIAYGMANYGVADVRKIAGLRSSQIEAVLGYHYGDEVVHRNNLVLV